MFFIKKVVEMFINIIQPFLVYVSFTLVLTMVAISFLVLLYLLKLLVLTNLIFGP